MEIKKEDIPHNMINMLNIVGMEKLIKISNETNNLGNRVVEFSDTKGECLGCAMCAKRCPDLAITEVYRG